MSHFLFKKFVSWLLLAGCLTGCASLSEAPRPQRPLTRDDFSVSGRFSAQYQRVDGTTTVMSGAFEWQQQETRTQIELRSPLGQTLAQIRIGTEARLMIPNQPTRTAADGETLMQQALGWALPVRGLRDWLLGQTPPIVGAVGAPMTLMNAPTQRLIQDGWQIDYLNWKHTRPQRITLTPLTPASLLELRLTLDRWE